MKFLEAVEKKLRLLEQGPGAEEPPAIPQKAPAQSPGNEQAAAGIDAAAPDPKSAADIDKQGEEDKNKVDLEKTITIQIIQKILDKTIELVRAQDATKGNTLDEINRVLKTNTGDLNATLRSILTIVDSPDL